MSPLRPFVRRHRFSTFTALTFVLTWLPWLTAAWLLRTGRPPVVTTLILIGGFGPFLAAVLVAAAGGDLRSWLRNLVDPGAPLRVWAAAVLVPVALYALALGVLLLAGGGFDPASVLPAAAVPVVFHTFSNAVSVTTATGVVDDGVVSQVSLLVVVWVVVAVLVWRYGTDRLASKPLPDGGLDFATVDDPRRSGRYRGDVLRERRV